MENNKPDYLRHLTHAGPRGTDPRVLGAPPADSTGAGGPDCPSGHPASAPGDLLSRSLGSFSESLDALRATCTILERKCTSLNWALETANRKLRESLEERGRLASRLDGILRCLSVGVVAVDLEGRLIEFNDAAAAITGYMPEQVLGTLYSDVVGRGQPESAGPLHVMETGIRVEHEEKWIAASDGAQIPVGFSTSLVKAAGGETLGAVEVFSDLRQAKLIEEELLRTRTLAAVGEMAAEVARQIRNPLAGLAGFAELLARELAGDQGPGLLVGKIREGVAGIEGAVARLVEDARPIDPNFRRMDAVAVLKRVLDLFEGSLGEEDRITLIRRFECEEAHARLDEEQFRQAVWNLLVNARDAMRGGGTLTVTIGTAPASRGVRPLSPSANAIVLSVADTGEGMTRDQLENAFAPFYTTREGSPGLGLTTVRRIVAGHGGEVNIMSDLGRGTRVTVRLPSEPLFRPTRVRKEESCPVSQTRSAS